MPQILQPQNRELCIKNAKNLRGLKTSMFSFFETTIKKEELQNYMREIAWNFMFKA